MAFDSGISANLKVDFSGERKKLIQQALDRLPYSFVESCALRQFLAALVRQSEELYNSCIDMQEQRQIYNAQGDVLDGLGRIVGLSRKALVYYESKWLWFDRVAQPWDVTNFWAKDAPLKGYQIYDDNQYKKRIILKIGKNFVKFASVPEIAQFVRMATGQPVGFVKTAPMAVDLIVPSTLTRDNYGILVDALKTLRCDDVYEVPYPVTLSISGVIMYVPQISFQFDHPAPYNWDSGRWAVSTSILRG